MAIVRAQAFFLTFQAKKIIPLRLQDRIRQIVASNGLKPPAGFLRFVTPDLQEHGVMPNLGTLAGQAAIEAILGEAQVIVVDNLSCLVRGGKENEADSWHPVAEWALRMRASGRSVVFIHHAGKGGQQRGASKREDLLDVVIKLQRPTDYKPEQGARFTVHFEKARSLYGALVAPFEAQLSEGEDGRSEWVVSEFEDNNQLLDLQAQGLSLSKMAEVIGCNKSTVKRRLDKLKDAA